VGGGRIIGECCHFIDLLRYVADAPIESHTASIMPTGTRDTLTATLSFTNGTIATLHYFANGSRAFPKERLEVFTAGRILAIDNFRSLRGFGWNGFRRQSLWRQDKGQAACVEAFLDAVSGRRRDQIPADQLEEVALACIEIARSRDGEDGSAAEARQ
jgi:predicted dehydrogenase